MRRIIEMYDCEGVVTNDPKINKIYYKFVQEQMIRALDNGRLISGDICQQVTD
jgi:hypothetical protein